LGEPPPLAPEELEVEAEAAAGKRFIVQESGTERNSEGECGMNLTNMIGAKLALSNTNPA
jgi:hypothetical protein